MKKHDDNSCGRQQERRLRDHNKSKYTSTVLGYDAMGKPVCYEETLRAEALLFGKSDARPVFLKAVASDRRSRKN